MRRSILLGWVLLVAFPLHAFAEPLLTAEKSRAARKVPIGSTIVLDGLPLGPDKSGPVTMKRIDIYAPDAQILVIDRQGTRAIPRSNWLHFLADKAVPGAPRIGLSLSPDGREAQGLVMGSDGRAYAITSTRFGGGLRFSLVDARKDLRGAPTELQCKSDSPAAKGLALPGHEESPIKGLTVSAGDAAHKSGDKAASRSGVVAVDTDNEFMSIKFANNTTNAGNYVAALILGMNVIYERDLDLTLVQGTTLLRVAADPYAANGSDIFAQLDEFEAFWAANQGAVSRAFAMQLSGKSSSPNSASGLANVLLAVTPNYCTSRSANTGTYSVSQVFTFPGSNAGHDVSLVAHELGHNFGAFHTHCSSAVTGAGNTTVGTIDQCFVEGSGCYAGPTSCPAATTVNGVPNVRGTLMSYCHFLGGCSASDVFATAHRNFLLPKVVANVGFACFTSGLGPNIFANGFE